MTLEKNRWLFVNADGCTQFKFGKYNGKTMAEVLRDRGGKWYIQEVMLGKFEDMTPGVRAYLEAALAQDRDPIIIPDSTPNSLAAPAATPAIVTTATATAPKPTLEELRAKAAAKVARAAMEERLAEAKRKQEEEQAALRTRRDNAEW